MLITRVLAALLFAPALLGLVALGGEPLRLTCALLSGLMFWEALNLLVPAQARTVRAAAWAAGAWVLAQSLSMLPGPPNPLGIGTCCIVLLLAALVSPGPLEDNVQAACGALMAAVYACTLMPLLWRLREVPTLGLGLALMALFCTWASDTGAYFAGRAFGKRKLYPRISPGKTLEGALGGLVFAAAMAQALKMALGLPLSSAQALTIGLLAATLGVLGDLSESLLKRRAGVKDSSRLIPGHGGFLDRFDGVLFALFGVDVYTRWALGA